MSVSSPQLTLPLRLHAQMSRPRLMYMYAHAKHAEPYACMHRFIHAHIHAVMTTTTRLTMPLTRFKKISLSVWISLMLSHAQGQIHRDHIQLHKQFPKYINYYLDLRHVRYLVCSKQHTSILNTWYFEFWTMDTTSTNPIMVTQWQSQLLDLRKQQWIITNWWLRMWLH